MTQFDTAFERSLNSEGVFQDDHEDRGNWTSGKIGVGELKGTKFGISAMTYPHLDIKNLTAEQAKEIYYEDWWLKFGMEQFHPAMQYQMFDAAINHGMYNATRIVQRAVKEKSDGIIGPRTLGSVRNTDLNDLLMQFLAERLIFMTDSRTWGRYGRGWARRIAHNLKFAAHDN
jgi:lysozyme family protein